MTHRRRHTSKIRTESGCLPGSHQATCRSGRQRGPLSTWRPSEALTLLAEEAALHAEAFEVAGWAG